MALVYNYCGMHETPQTAVRIVVQADANGTCHAVVNGVTYNADNDIDTSVINGYQKIDITGLTAGTTYDVDIYIGGVFQKSTKAKTLPLDNVRMLFASCLSNAAYQAWIAYGETRNADILYGAGDFNYEDNLSVNSYQEAVVNTGTNCQNMTNRWNRLHNFFILPEVQSFFDTGVQFLFMWDDHELFDSWAFDLNQADIIGLREPGVITTDATLQQVLDTWRITYPYLQAWHYGNPANPESPAAELPENSDNGTDAVDGDFPPLYTRINIGDLIEIYALDVQGHRSPMTDADNGSQAPITKTCLGAVQREWLKTQGAASTANFNMIMMGKYVWEFTNEVAVGDPQGDRWNQYPSERADIAADVDANWPTGTFSISGDVHIPTTGDDGQLWNFCICPGGIDNVKRDTPYGENVLNVWPGANLVSYKYIGEIDISTSQVDITLIDIVRDRRYQTISFDNTSNRPITPAQKAIGS